MVFFEKLSEATEYIFNVVDNNSLCTTTYEDIEENEKNLIELANSESGTCNIVIDTNFGLYFIDLTLDKLLDFYEIHIEWNAVPKLI